MRSERESNPRIHYSARIGRRVRDAEDSMIRAIDRDRAARELALAPPSIMAEQLRQMIQMAGAGLTIGQMARLRAGRFYTNGKRA